MTGNETLIIQGGKGVYGKVRHDGFDILDWIKDVGAENVVKMKLDDVWKTYYEWRSKDQSPESQAAEINSQYQRTGYSFDIPAGLPGGDDPDMIQDYVESLLRTEEESKQKTDPDFNEGFTCGYNDYCLVIDLDAGSIFVNGEVHYFQGMGRWYGLGSSGLRNMAKIQPPCNVSKDTCQAGVWRGRTG